ncbi:MAG: hypothetical protein PHO94_13210 [Petrimonas sp.]|nr:hypothetical protein [Petrimonas sp.]
MKHENNLTIIIIIIIILNYLRQNNEDLLYFSMDELAITADRPTDRNLEATLIRDAKTYKPIRDAMAHTSLLTAIAKQSLNTTYENIKARIKNLLNG